MKRMVLLMLMATLSVLLAAAIAGANGTSAQDYGQPTAESETGTATGTTGTGTETGAMEQPTTTEQTTTTQTGTTTQYGATTQGVVCPPGFMTPAVAIENQDIYVVAGNVVTKFDRNLMMTAQAILPMSGTSVAMVQPGMMSQPGAMTQSSSTMSQSSTTMPQPGTTVSQSTTTTMSQPGAMTQYGTMTPSGTMAQPGMVSGTFTAMNPTITVQNQDVYVIANGSIYKFDRNLNMVQVAALPGVSGTAIAMVPGPYGTYGQYGQVSPSGQVIAQGQLVCPPGMQPSVVQPGVAGFRQAPTLPQRWVADLSGTPLQTSTSASGDAEFWLSNQGQTLNYRINARNISNVTGVTLQLMQPGLTAANAPLVATLFQPRHATTAVTGRLVSGSLTARDLVGPYRGQPLSALVNAINSGQVIVNVNTSRNPNGLIAGTLTVGTG